MSGHVGVKMGTCTSVDCEFELESRNKYPCIYCCYNNRGESPSMWQPNRELQLEEERCKKE